MEGTVKAVPFFWFLGLLIDSRIERVMAPGEESCGDGVGGGGGRYVLVARGWSRNSTRGVGLHTTRSSHCQWHDKASRLWILALTCAWTSARVLSRKC